MGLLRGGLLLSGSPILWRRGWARFPRRSCWRRHLSILNTTCDGSASAASRMGESGRVKGK